MVPAFAAKSNGQILLRSRGARREILLNRPEALNALTLEMIDDMRAVLVAYAKDPEVGFIVVRGAGERGLCAGGDIRRIYQSLQSTDDWPGRMWSSEYALNSYIAKYPKPYVALMDGIVMGGGIGISAHGRYRVVTERTKAAMPEVGIGLIPDVGATWLLSRAPGETGTCLALSGMTFGAGDAIYAGLADTYVPSSRLDDMVGAIAGLEVGNVSALAHCIASYSGTPPPSTLELHRTAIDTCFRHDTIEDMIVNLDNAGTAFATGLAASLRNNSPTSLKVTLKLLRLARHSTSLEDCLGREYSAVLHAAARATDLKEGIRAAIIDKDRKPRWSPSEIENVSDSDVAGYLNHQPSIAIPFVH